MALGTLVAAALLLAPERLIYVWISRRPEQFARTISPVPWLRDAGPIDAVSYLFVLFKLVQAGVFVGWCWAMGAGAPIATEPHTVALVSGVLLVGLGQYLNVQVFALLGRDGVFYGNRFGVHLPWRHEFPFSWLSHPQYVGTVLSIWGFFLVVRFPESDWYVLPVLESAYYALGARFEA